MEQKMRITEYLDIDLKKEVWCCNRCERELGSARENYKNGCLCYERDVSAIYDPVTEDGAFAPDPNLGPEVPSDRMVRTDSLLLALYCSPFGGRLYLPVL